MTISMRSDCDGNSYQIWAQQQENSCTVASIWMARCMARQMTFAEEEWDLASRMYSTVIADTGTGGGRGAPAGPQTLDSRQHHNDRTSFSNTWAVAGASLRHAASMLRQEGLFASPELTGNVDISRLSPTTPALVGLHWLDAAGEANGGHCIVAVRRNSYAQVVYLDPGWGGLLRELPNDGVIPHPNRSLSGQVYGACYLAA